MKAIDPGLLNRDGLTDEDFAKAAAMADILAKAKPSSSFFEEMRVYSRRRTITRKHLNALIRAYAEFRGCAKGLKHTAYLLERR